MAATVTKLHRRWCVSLDAFLDSPKINRYTHSRRVLHWRKAAAGQSWRAQSLLSWRLVEVPGGVAPTASERFDTSRPSGGHQGDDPSFFLAPQALYA